MSRVQKNRRVPGPSAPQKTSPAKSISQHILPTLKTGRKLTANLIAAVAASKSQR